MPDSKTFQPGEGSAIQVVLKTDHFIGPLTKEVTLFTNEEKSPLHRLTIIADVVPDYTVDTPVIAYGELEVVDSQDRLVTISGRDPQQPFQILELVYSRDILEVSHSEIKANIWQLVVRLKSNASPGVIHEKITVKSNNQHKPLMDIYVTALLRNPIRLEPSYLDFGSIDKEGSAERSLTLTSAHEFSVNLKESRLELNGIPLAADTAVLELAPAKPGAPALARQHSLALSLRQLSTAKTLGNVHGKLFLQTSKGTEQQVISMDVYGYFN
jgi:hypothetical protein